MSEFHESIGTDAVGPSTNPAAMIPSGFVPLAGLSTDPNVAQPADDEVGKAAPKRFAAVLPLIPKGKPTRIGLAVGLSVALLAAAIVLSNLKTKNRSTSQSQVETVVSTSETAAVELEGAEALAAEPSPMPIEAAPAVDPPPELARPRAAVVAAIPPPRARANPATAPLPEDDEPPPLVQTPVATESEALVGDPEPPSLEQGRLPDALAQARLPADSDPAPPDLPTDLPASSVAVAGPSASSPVEPPAVDEPAPPLPASRDREGQPLPRTGGHRHPVAALAAASPVVKEETATSIPATVEVPLPGTDLAPAPAIGAMPPLTTPPAAAAVLPGPEGEWVPLPNARNRRAAAAVAVSTPTDPSLAPARQNDPPLDTIARAHSAASDSPTEPIRHIVRRGENFWTISRYYYGSGRFWKALWAANQDVVAAPEKLEVGMTILIPLPEALDRTLVEGSQSATLPPPPSRKTSNRETTHDSAMRRVSSEVNADPSPETPGLEKLSTPVPNRRVGLPVYTVRRPNETIRSIARDQLGDPRRDQEILELNADRIRDPNRLTPGMAIRLPDDRPIRD